MANKDIESSRPNLEFLLENFARQILSESSTIGGTSILHSKNGVPKFGRR